MPELPEVETVLRGMEPVFLDHVVGEIDLRRRDLRFPIPEELPVAMRGQKIGSLIRRGKYILFFTEKGPGGVLHLGMSGRVKIFPDDKSYEPEKHDHVIIRMGHGPLVVFNDARRFGFLKAANLETWNKDDPFSKMGPEPLGNHFHAAYLKEKFHGKAGPIKSALLDQTVVAGVGNIYACEALFRAGIHPEVKAGSISAARLESLCQAIRDVLNEAIEVGGSTLRDHHKTDGAMGYFQHRFAVYNKEGSVCPVCVSNNENDPCVHRIVQSGRSSFFCSRTQR